MPKRTNEFQDLVALIQKTLAPDGATITESAEVCPDGATREIDVLIDTKVGEYRITIAVEAKDEGRPMDMTKFESMIGKYIIEGGVKVNKVVIITHQGFTKNVIGRAKTLGIDLLTLREAKDFDWSQFRPPGPAFKCWLKIENISLMPDLGPLPDVLQRAHIVCSCGEDHGNPAQYAMQSFWNTAVKNTRTL